MLFIQGERGRRRWGKKLEKGRGRVISRGIGSMEGGAMWSTVLFPCLSSIYTLYSSLDAFLSVLADLGTRVNDIFRIVEQFREKKFYYSGMIEIK